MMKKIFAVCLALVLFAAPALAELQEMNELEQLRRQVSLTWSRYENMVYGFSLSVPDSFISMADDAAIKQWLDELAEDESSDEVYDMRYWGTSDNAITFEVQVKEPTYESFAVECEKAPDYLDYIQEDMDAAGYQNLSMLHEGIIRETPIGEMLEMAIMYEYPASGSSVQIIQVYYDLYIGELEFIFNITGNNMSYDDLQFVLDTIVWTANITL